MAHGTGTKHHKIHGVVGWGLIIGLPFAIGSAVKAVSGGSPENASQGFIDWLSNPVSYTHLRAPRDRQKSRMPSSA